MRLNKILALSALSLFLIVGCGKTPDSSPATSSTPSTTSSNSSPTSSTPSNSTTMDSAAKYSFPGILSAEEIQNKKIRIKTDKGDIVFELFSDTAPLAVSNFVYLTKESYYNGLTFHRREEGFVIQGGDPLGNGRGGPGYRFQDELNDSYTYTRGIVAMANAGANTNGSQFFIMLADVSLPKKYTIFGRVLEGMDIVDQIKVGDVMEEVVVEDNLQS